MTAKLLFLSCVVCDIQTTVAFLTMRVKQPDKENWGKLRRVLKYLNSTHSLPLTYFAESLTKIHWYVVNLTKDMTIAKATQALFLRLAKVLPQIYPLNRRYPPKAHLKVKLLPCMTNLVIYFGHVDSLKLKGTISQPMSCFKTT